MPHRRRGRPRRRAPSPAPPPAAPEQRPAAVQQPRLVRATTLLVTGGVLGLLLIAGLILLVRGTATPPCAPDPSGWNGAGGGPAQRGAAAIAVGDPGAGWAPAWTSPAAAGSLTGPPSAARGAVYSARADGTLVVLDAVSGRLLWTSAADERERGRALVAVALDGCTAVVATSFDGGDGRPAGAVRTVDLETHARRWGVTTDDVAASAPEIEEGFVYVGMAQRATGGGALDRTYSVDGYTVQDGSRAYRKQFRAAVVAPPASDGTHIWAGTLDGTVYALGADERQLWSFTTGGVVSAGIAVGDNALYAVSADHMLYALDQDAPRERWHVDLGSQAQTAPVVAADGTVVGAGRDGDVVAADPVGRVRWRRHLDAPVTRGGLATAARRVVVVDDAGTVHLLDLATGRDVASWAAPAPPAGPPALVAGRLLVTCVDGRLYALPV